MKGGGHQGFVDACARPGCPLCGCLHTLATRHLRAVLGEHVTDPLSRGRLAEAWGFCAVHAAGLGRMPEAALGAAIIYHALVEQAGRWLDETARAGAPAAKRGRWRALVDRGRNRPRGGRSRRRQCPVCIELGAAETGLLDALVAGTGLDAAYARSDGLCLPHLERALSRAPGPAAARLVAQSRERLAALAEDLRGFVDKHDHRSTPRFTAREAGAWQRALALVAGREDLFGPEIPRGEADGPGRPATARPRR